MTIWFLLLVLIGRPLAPISYPACFSYSSEDFDLIAREVSTVAEATWCVTIVNDCKNALIVIYRKPDAKDTYVISEACSR